jgi:hypothetical protein
VLPLAKFLVTSLWEQVHTHDHTFLDSPLSTPTNVERTSTLRWVHSENVEITNVREPNFVTASRRYYDFRKCHWSISLHHVLLVL